jgi:CheY-like chemotaxis protein/GAF domain-containing protein/PAS domain-containing protein
VSARRRILVLEGPAHAAAPVLRDCAEDVELVHVDNLVRGLELLRAEHFAGVYADTTDPTIWEWAGNLVQGERIFKALPDGVAVVNAELRIVWANAAFERWCRGPVAGKGFYDALDSPEILGPDYSPFHTALAGKSTITRLHCRDNRYLELHITPVVEADGKVSQLISLGRDVTAEVNQQQKLNAIHQAGRELAGLAADQLADMSVEERVELLKLNIRRLTHDLLHYDVIEIRLIDPQTGKLEPLLSEGMSPQASQRTLYAKAEGNGVTGFVAATGKSYLCPDTAVDPLYIEGAAGARSSLTVPLIARDQVIGTFNVESPQQNAFGEADLQFAEIFSREIASALHTLELLQAEKRSTASQSVEAISREVALPVDEILAAATTVLDRYIGHDPEMAEKLRQILTGARALKQCIQKVGEDLAPARTACRPGEKSHPALKGLRVLVVDNDERVRRSAHAILGRFGCVVETARDGQEALTMARLSSYDVMLADIRLPDLNGYEVFYRLRQIQPQARVILMTAYGYDPSHSIVKARQEGLRSVLYKPFRIDQLLDALENPDSSPSAATAGPKAAGVQA